MFIPGSTHKPQYASNTTKYIKLTLSNYVANQERQRIIDTSISYKCFIINFNSKSRTPKFPIKSNPRFTHFEMRSNLLNFISWKFKKSVYSPLGDLQIRAWKDLRTTPLNSHIQACEYFFLPLILSLFLWFLWISPWISPSLNSPLSF